MATETLARPTGKVTIWARRGGQRLYGGQKVNYGQIIDVNTDAPNAVALSGLGYIKEFDLVGDSAAHCTRCGGWFIDSTAVSMHNEFCLQEPLEILEPVALPDVPTYEEED